MNIVRFDPFREMATLQDRVNRIFADAYNRHGEDDLTTRGAWVPPVDIFENDNHELVLKAELPDVTREDISLRVENNTLTISGHKKAETDVKEQQYRRIERTYGSFSRSFTLPDGADVEHADADLKSGVLVISIPKKPEHQPRKISLKSGGDKAKA